MKASVKVPRNGAAVDVVTIPQVRIKRGGKEIIMDRRADGTIKDIRTLEVSMASPVTSGALSLVAGRQSIKVEPRVVTPDLAQHWLDNFMYDKQRRVEKGRVLGYAKAITEDRWISGTEINFGIYQGRPYIMNGQHRLRGVVEAGKPAIFTIVEHLCEEHDDLALLYCALDRQKPRGFQDLLRTTGLPEATGLTAQALGLIATGARLASSDFLNTSLPARQYMSVEELRERMDTWIPSAQAFFEAIKESETLMKQRLYRSPVLAVAMTTIKYAKNQRNKERAIEFWRGIAENDGLRKGDPRHTAMKYLLTTTLSGGYSTAAHRSTQPYFCRALIVAFNAWMTNREISSLRVPDDKSPTHINGTTWGKARAEEEADNG